MQWLRNEPLVPAPIAKAVARAATAATQATQQLVQHFAPAAAPKAPATIAAKPARPRALLTRRPAVPAATPTMPTKMAVLAVPAADSLATAPVALPATADATGTVHGRITDTQGRPLPGATVLVRGTGLATSANAAGDYVLAVPSGATLQFGYGGYADQSQRSPGTGIVNVTLQPAPNGVLRRRQR